MDRRQSIQFLGQPCNVTVFQVYAPNTDAKEMETDELCGHARSKIDMEAMCAPYGWRPNAKNWK